MTLEQKMWIAGSYFHYSAVDWWENIEACDVIGNSGDKNVVFDALGASGGAFIVQARKIESLTDKVWSLLLQPITVFHLAWNMFYTFINTGLI